MLLLFSFLRMRKSNVWLKHLHLKNSKEFLKRNLNKNSLTRKKKSTLVSDPKFLTTISNCIQRLSWIFVGIVDMWTICLFSSNSSTENTKGDYRKQSVSQACEHFTFSFAHHSFVSYSWPVTVISVLPLSMFEKSGKLYEFRDMICSNLLVY